MTTARLTWNAATDNVAVATYRIYRIVDNALWDLTTPFASVSGNVLTYDDTTLTANHIYHWLVRARDAAGNEGVYSSSVLVSTYPNDVDSAPRNLTATAQTTQIDLSWLVPTTVPSIVATYVVFRDGALAWANNGNDLTWSDRNLPPSTQHTYEVVAVSPTGLLSPASNTVTVSTLADTQAPVIPVRAPTATALSPTSVLLDWDSFTDNVGVVQHIIYRNAALRATTGPGITSFQDDSVLASTGYIYQVVALDAANNTSAPIGCSVTTPPSGGTANTYYIPGNIDRTGATDVTNALKAFIASVPDGANAFQANKIIAPANSLYRCESEIQLVRRKNLDFNWQDSTLFCRTDGSYDYPGSYSAQWPAQRVQFNIIMCEFIWVRNLTIMGANFPGNGHGCYGQYALPYESSGQATIPTPTVHLTAGINTSQTTITVDSWNGFPQAPFWVCVGDMNADYEVMRVTSGNGLTATVVRSGVAGNTCPTLYSVKRSRSSGTEVHLGRVGGDADPYGSFIVRLESQDPILVRGNNQGGPPFDGHDVNLDNIRTHYAFGDGVGVGYNAFRVTVTNGTFTHTGRQGTSPAGCDTVTFDNCHWDLIGRTVFDMEPAADWSIVRNVLWKNCSNGWATGNWFNCNGRGRGPSSPPYGLSNIEIRDHFTVYPIQGVMSMDSPWGIDNPWGPFALIRVSSDHGSDSPWGMRFRRVYGVTLKGNFCPWVSTSESLWTFSCRSRGYDYGGLQEALFTQTDGNIKNLACRSDNGGSIGQKWTAGWLGLNPNVGSQIYPKNYAPKNGDGTPANTDWGGTDAFSPPGG